MRTFTVSKMLLGYHVHVGCQSVCVSEDKKDELKKLICDYIDDPEGMEKKYYTKAEECRPQQPQELARPVSVSAGIERPR